jgi:DNA (cytosine-5)-methyltransferase 1
MTLRIGSLCTGYAGLDMAVQQVFGGELAWVADPDPGAAAILAHHHPDVPNLGDITKTNWEDVEPVDLLCGGYPCQPFSSAGLQKGVEDERHIWPYIATALRVLRPGYALFENVANHLRIGFDVVLADLAGLGFDVEWCTVRASEIGAAHGRPRLIFLATAADAPHLGHERSRHARGRRLGPANRGLTSADTDCSELAREPRQQSGRVATARGSGGPAADTDRGGQRQNERDIQPRESDIDWGAYGPAVRRWERTLGRPAPWPTEPGQRGKPRLNPAFSEWMMGLPAGHVTAVPGLSRNQQLKAIGNGVVPQQATAAIQILLERRAAA